MESILPIVSRWIHVISACVVIGGLFFMRIVLPIGLQSLEPENQKALFLKLRSIFKRIVHTAILLFLISGTYNAYLIWPQYSAIKGLGHALFGMHVLLALIVFGIALVGLAGKEPPKAHKGMMAANLVLLLLVVAFASTLKSFREKANLKPAAERMSQPQ
jgi:uncharacterized membrane protein